MTSLLTDPSLLPVEIRIYNHLGAELPVAAKEEVDARRARIDEMGAGLALMEEALPEDRETKLARVDLELARQSFRLLCARMKEIDAQAVTVTFHLRPYTVAQRTQARQDVIDRDLLKETGQVFIDADRFMARLLPFHVAGRDGVPLTPDNVRGYNTSLAGRLWNELRERSEPTTADVLFRGGSLRGSDVGGGPPAGGAGPDDSAADVGAQPHAAGDAAA